MQIVRLSRHDPLVEVGLTTVVAYAAFILANYYLKFSGVMAACTAGMVVNYYGKRYLAEDMFRSIHRFWAFACFLANSIIFLLLGLTESFLVAHFGRLWTVATAVGIAIVAVVASRVLIVGLTGLGFNAFAKRENRITLSMQFIQVWGGLRGALPIALAAMIAPKLISREEHVLIVQMTLGIILFSLLVQGTTIQRFMRRFGMVQTGAAAE